MSSKPTTEKRLQTLEVAFAILTQDLEAERVVNRTLQAILCTLIDSLSADRPAQAEEWLGAMEHVARENVSMTADLATDAIIRDHGLDTEMLAAAEQERDAVIDRLSKLYAMLKRPQGSVG